jgi:hypothetical protein
MVAKRARSVAALAAALWVACVVAADSAGEAVRAPTQPTMNAGWDDRGPVAFNTEFQFTRLRFQSTRDGFYRESWLTDWPAAEYFLLQGVERLTRLDTASDSRLISLADEDLFDYPFIYAVEPGAWRFSEFEAERLRDYLLRGGFLMVDDFHGSREWAGFESGLRRVFPDREIVEIPRTDSVFHTVYELNEPVQIPGIMAAMRGVTWEKDGYTPHWRGIYDDDGNLMVIINFNMDLGDAWEHADVPDYALRYTIPAYQYAINYMVYAMTH